MTETQNITQLLLAWNNGEATALDKLMPLVESELHRIASRYMRRENYDHTLQTTALVNEAYLKLIDQKRANFQNRAHFFALASQIMRRILLDHAKTQKRDKRGGGAVHVDIADVAIITPQINEDLIALDTALLKLEEFDALKSRIVVMRHFGGMEVKEVAEVLQIAEITVMRHWSLAKAWLRRELEK
jgi:RNA polymerase sigma-70 factor (ECF subfamily)